MKTKLTASEATFCNNVSAGEPARLKGKRIDASVIRQLLLGLPPCKPPQNCITVTAAGIELHGATIAGRLNLENMTGVGGAPLPSLVFEDCRFVSGLSAAHAHLGRLSLLNCRFEGDDTRPSIDLTGAQLSTDIDLSGVRAVEEDGLCWVSMRGARIDGNLKAWGAFFRGPGPRENEARDQRRRALNLDMADVIGSVQLTQTTVERGFSASNSTIGGDVWLSGDTFTTYLDDAVNFQSAHIKGNLMLTSLVQTGEQGGRAFVSEGALWMLGVRVEGSLRIRGADVTSPGFHGLVLDGSTIGDLAIREGDRGVDDRTAMTGSISALNLSVAHNVVFSQLRLDKAAELRLTGCEIGGDLLIHDLGGRPEETSVTHTSFGHELPGPSRVDISMTHCRRLEIFDSFASHFIARGTTTEASCYLGLNVTHTADLTELNVGASLDLTPFRFASNGGELCLKDADIKRALRLSQPWGESNPFKSYRIVSAREKSLLSMPGYRLVEAVWNTRVVSTPRVQTMHLIRPDGGVETFDGSRQPLEQAIEKGHIDLKGRDEVIEFLRLFSGVWHGDDSLFRIVTELSELHRVDAATSGSKVEAPPPGPSQLEPPRVEQEADIEDGTSAVSPPADDADARTKDAAGDRLFTLADLPAEALEVKFEKVGKTFDVWAAVLYDRSLYRARFRITPSPAKDEAVVFMVEDTKLTVNLDLAPIRMVKRQIQLPLVGDVPQALPPLLPGMEGLKLEERERLAPKLLVGVAGEARLTEAKVDLRDVSCDTLEDRHGAAWDENVRLKLDRFTYRQVDSGDIEDGSVAQRRKDDATTLPRSLAMFDIIRWISAHTGRLTYLVEVIERKNTRLAWLRRQYKNLEGKRFPPAAEYRPQPFEQIITVSRAAGDEEAAIAFEIEKILIESRLFDRRTRTGFSIAGGLFCLLAMAAAWVAHLALLPTILIGVTIFFGVAYVVAISQLVFRLGFGYLRRPLNAFVTLVLSILIGYAGVFTANARGLLIVDLTPVAPAIGSRAQAEDIGTPEANGVHSDVPCGRSIDELLYAVDVFIPLIDLRQEDRCEVGPAHRELSAAEPAAPPRIPWLAAVSRLADPALDSPRFWELAKAIYAIIGWIVISLTILTFARATRQREEN
ncbi:hypothetical protein DMC18_01905 [Caulobacter sp. D5]|nr:hypothetical protein DMC18_01905 [Caulobacter sp. D5]